MWHKIRNCIRARAFIAPQTRGNDLSIEKGRKRVAEPSDPRQRTQTLGKQDGHGPSRAYAMKAVEDTDALNVIVGNFTIFDIIMHALIDPGSTHSYICIDIPSLGNLSSRHLGDEPART